MLTVWQRSAGKDRAHEAAAWRAASRAEMRTLRRLARIRLRPGARRRIFDTPKRAYRMGFTTPVSLSGDRMNISARAGILALLLAAIIPAQAADKPLIERLATCQDSWFEWKSSDPARLQQFVAGFQSDFSQKERGPFFVPKSSQTVIGLPVAQVFPESVGMRRRLSSAIAPKFETDESGPRRRIGKPSKCEPPSDNMRTCGWRSARKRPFC
jgi:hypothetical protein